MWSKNFQLFCFSDLSIFLNPEWNLKFPFILIHYIIFHLGFLSVKEGGKEGHVKKRHRLQHSSKASSARPKERTWAQICRWRSLVSHKNGTALGPLLSPVTGGDKPLERVTILWRQWWTHKGSSWGHQPVMIAVAGEADFHGFHRCCLTFNGKLFSALHFLKPLILSS